MAGINEVSSVLVVLITLAVNDLPLVSINSMPDLLMKEGTIVVISAEESVIELLGAEPEKVTSNG